MHGYYDIYRNFDEKNTCNNPQNSIAVESSNNNIETALLLIKLN